MEVVREAFCRDIDTFSWEFGKFEDPDNPESWQIAKFVFYVLLVISVIILIAVLIYLKKYYKAIFVICYIIVWIITIYMYNTPVLTILRIGCYVLILNINFVMNIVIFLWLGVKVQTFFGC